MQRRDSLPLGAEKLGPDMGIPDDGGSWSGIALAHNVRSRDEVHSVIEQARANGAEITREPAETFYGGYAGAFRDLDGHAWEIAHNPGFGLDDDGNIVLPRAGRLTSTRRARSKRTKDMAVVQDSGHGSAGRVLLLNE